MQLIIDDLKSVYSIAILEQIPIEKRQYFYDLVNSIPDDIFSDSFKAIKNKNKLKSFLGSLNKELENEGMNMDILKSRIEEFNKRWAAALKKSIIGAKHV